LLSLSLFFFDGQILEQCFQHAENERHLALIEEAGIYKERTLLHVVGIGGAVSTTLQPFEGD
jgi:hypothetical protein